MLLKIVIFFCRAERVAKREIVQMRRKKEKIM
jgi:hypothetical protein